jgi:hypothetical protein
MGSDSLALNDSVRQYPYSSQRYQRVFNQKAEDLGYDFRWTEDRRDFNSIEPGELELSSDRSRPGAFDPQLKRDVKRVLQEVESERLRLAEQSANLHEHIPFRAPFEKLRPVEQAAVRLLYRRVKPLIDRIEACQHTPQAPAQADWMGKFGDKNSQQLFARFHHDQMAGPLYYEEKASLFPTFPEKEPINGMIDRSISMDEFQKLAVQLPAGSQEMRPTTVLTKPNGKVEAHALAQDPRFRADHLALSQAMTDLSRLQVDGQKLDSKTAAQFSAWAQYFKTGDGADEARAVQASIDAGESDSLLRVHLGPSESYWADNVKFPYDIQVGVRDPEIQAEMKNSTPQFLEVEQSLSDIPHYQPRPVKTRGGFADPIYQIFTGGFVETFYAREVKGVNFPNYPYDGVEGSNRFMLLEAMAPVASHAREIAHKLLDRVPDKLEETENMYCAYHESGHLLGPQRSHVTPSGVPMGMVFGSDWGAAEEPKADLNVIEMISRRAQDGTLTQAEKRTHLEAATNILLSFYPGKKLFQEGKATDHYYGYLLQAGYLLQQGAVAVVETSQGSRLHVDADKVESASHDLFRKLITLQSLGQKDEFVSFGRSLIESIPDSVDQMILKAQGQYRPYFVDHQVDFLKAD